MNKKYKYLILAVIFCALITAGVLIYKNRTNKVSSDKKSNEVALLDPTKPSIDLIKDKIKTAPHFLAAEKIIKEAYGEPNLKQKKGFYADIWELREGDIFAVGGAIKFKDKNGGDLPYLIQTKNSVKYNLYANFDLRNSIKDIEDSTSQGMMIIDGKGEYEFVYLGQESYLKENYSSYSFFKENSKGIVEIELNEGVQMTSLLEDITSDGQVKEIAKVKFTSKSGNTLEGTLKADPLARSIYFVSMNKPDEKLKIMRSWKTIFYSEVVY